MRWTIMAASAAVLFLLNGITVAAQSPQDAPGKPERAAESAPPHLSPDEQRAGFVRLWSETKYNFASFDNVPDLDWDAVLDEYLPQFDRPRTRYDYYRILEKCMARLHDGHTRVVLGPFSDEDRPAILVKPVEGKAVITRVADDPEIAAQGVTAGCEIVKVGGRDVKDILEDIYPYVSASTPQMLADDSYWRILDGPPGSEAPVVIRDARGAERAVTLKRNGRGRPDFWRNVRSFDATGCDITAEVLRRANGEDGGAGGTEAAAAGPLDVFEYREIDRSIAYVAVRTFMTDEGPRGFKEVLDKVRASKGLIIDVRDNTGGCSEYGWSIVSRLTDKPLAASTWRSAQHVGAWAARGRQQKPLEGTPYIVEPADDAAPYLGPVVVLTNACTVSAAEDFLVPLNYSCRATLVGETTAGSTGNPLIVPLPGGGAAIVCAKHDTYPDGREFVGVGIAPDVEAHPTVADVAAGRDAILEKGIEVVKRSIADADAAE